MRKPRALILAPFSRATLQRLQKSVDVIYESWLETGKLLSPEELGERIRRESINILVIEADFVFEETFIAAADERGYVPLKFIGICRGDASHVDIKAATRYGVVVVTTPGRNAVSVAELTVGLMLSLARRIPYADRLVKEGRWESPVQTYATWGGIELAGKTAGIIGMGKVGREVARRLHAFDMHLLGYDPYTNRWPEHVHRVGLETLLRESDFVTVHCTLTPETTGLLGERELKLMKRTAFLINTARGPIVDEEALVQALKERHIAGVALDVYTVEPLPPSAPLLRLARQMQGKPTEPVIILTPHIGGAAVDVVRRQSEMIAEEIERFLRGEEPHNRVG